MDNLNHEQMGLWIASLVTFVTSVLALLAVYRVLTKNFVTRPELKIELLDLERKIEKEISDTRHLLRNEMNISFVKMENKLETIGDNQMAQRTSLARIEAILEVRQGQPEKPHTNQ
jgi:hypothetical protein